MLLGNHRRRYRYIGYIFSGSAACLFAILIGLQAIASESNRTADTTRNQSSSTHISLNLPIPALPLRKRITQPPAAIISVESKQNTNPGNTFSSNAPDKPNDVWHEVIVKSGDSLSSIFNRLKLNSIHSLTLAKGKETSILNRLHPGQQLQVKTLNDDLEEIVFDLDDFESVRVKRTEGGFDTERFHRNVDTRQNIVSGEIRSSLFSTAKNAGLSDNLTMELAEIFAWDIDFAQDIRQGDSFIVLYEEYYRDGDVIGAGDIIAAEFINQGKPYRALRYSSSDGKIGYYTPEGLSLRKPFLRTPVNFSRISSGFSLGRRHPILNTIRAHKGVDYAAPTGTPVRAAGDGKITMEGVNGGYGNCVVIQHGDHYSTLYGHLSKFRSGLKVGSRVSQGEIIGYVGKSGLATGPHLHYEFRIDGVHRNPLTVKLPGTIPLPKNEMASFAQLRKTIEARLDTYTKTRLASGKSFLTN